MNDLRFRRIGAGFCGTVWAPNDLEHGPAFKREDGGPDRSLQNDFEMHQRVLYSLRQLSNVSSANVDTGHPRIQIPECYDFIRPADEKWWTANLPCFPTGYSPCNVIHCQRIPPFPEPTRKLLVEKYCPPELSNEILSSDTNKDCLVRPYLGRRRILPNTNDRPSRFKAFSLRNYPLHLDQMEDLGISPNDMQSYARMMAEALAAMHWIGEIDGNDVEFVLAPNEHQPASGIIQNVLGEHTMWMLDFDLCRNMSMDEAGVRQAVTAFWRNDPFYPRPEKGSLLWKEFREQYLLSVKKCLSLWDDGEGSKRLHLSALFIHLLEKEELRGGGD